MQALSSLFLLTVVALTCAKHEDERVFLGSDGRDAFLEAHNKARREVGIDDVNWSYRLARAAGEVALKCEFQHSDFEYGENLAASGPRNDDKLDVIPKMVQMWHNEKKRYEKSKSWDCFKIYGPETCGHYSQMVWKDTTHIGCALAHCQKLQNFVVCEYDPPGNFMNQDPY